MANTSTANEMARPLRRSTRVTQAVPLTVMGVDSYRGPYREDVSTVSISCHGCKYESKHDVLTNSWVMLELKGDAPDQVPVTARGLVKWVQRAVDAGGMFQTAIELEDPGNIWGIATPPADWVPYCGPKDTELSPPKPKPFAVRKQEALGTVITEERRITAPPAHEARPSVSLASLDRPVGQLMGDFQRQIEQTLVEAANAAVHDRVSTVIGDARGQLKEDAQRFMAEAASEQSTALLREFVDQIRDASNATAQALHAEWSRKIDAKLQSTIDRIELRKQELEQHADGLAASGLDKFQRGLENARKESVTRIVERLKEQSAPVVEEAKNVTNELTRTKHELQELIEHATQQSAVKLEEMCVHLEKQFESVMQQRLAAARDELERAAQTATNLALSNLDVIAQHTEVEAKARFATALDPVKDEALNQLKQKADEAAQRFAADLGDYSRTHLEFVGNAISEFARGIGKRP